MVGVVGGLGARISEWGERCLEVGVLGCGICFCFSLRTSNNHLVAKPYTCLFSCLTHS